jgi:ArsR family transcriptional regulator, arsenate/arsenite/antimonite-responsive transcriptional repressor
MQVEKIYNESFSGIAKALQALSHPARLQVIEHLARYEECPAGEISNELPLSKSTVSQHMTKLREAGIIYCQQKGINQYYRLNYEKLNEVIHQIELFSGHITHLHKTKKVCKNLEPKLQREQGTNTNEIHHAGSI